jgi:hypothetical protein
LKIGKVVINGKKNKKVVFNPIGTIEQKRYRVGDTKIALLWLIPFTG